MFQKNSYTIPSDSSGVLLVKVIQTRRCSTRLHSTIGTFLRVVLRRVRPELSKRRKKKSRAIVIRTRKNIYKRDGLCYSFAQNALVLLKKRMNTVGKEIIGPTSKALKIRKFRNAFLFVY